MKEIRISGQEFLVSAKIIYKMSSNPVYKTLEIEGCELHYWSQGTGPLITFIPGGNGHGAQYNKIMALLSSSYTVATFDRRQMSDSTCEIEHILSVPQQARDVAAIIKALGFSKSTIFGSSLGGIISFQFAIDFPDMVEHLISHEAPTFSLLPDATKMHNLLYSCYQLYLSDGIDAGHAPFWATFVGYDDDDPKMQPMTQAPAHNPVNFWKNEFIAVFYVPDLRKIARNGTSTAVISGARSRDAWYSRTTVEQQDILGCVRIVAPGHHQGFEVEVDDFTPVFLELLKRLDREKAGKC